MKFIQPEFLNFHQEKKLKMATSTPVVNPSTILPLGMFNLDINLLNIQLFN